ncbi:MAG: hypothetical protein GEU94_15640 [Micromonosporaceae bacterium]|nr:hypothetical protein [Micromonosporaceae bacterium]
MLTNFLDAWRGAVAGELCWLGREEAPDVLPVVPLEWDGAACVALPYRHVDLADELRASEVGFAVTDRHSLPAGEPGRVGIGRVSVVEDIEGDVFADKLLPQELAKYPPSRALVDTLMLRRENWWWLPRLLVRLERVERTSELPARAEPGDALLLRDGVELRLDVVRAEDWGAEEIALRSVSGALLYGDGASAIAIGHDYTRPDLERWEPWARRGALRGDRLTVSERIGAPVEKLEPYGLLQRLRRHRDLERTCVEAVRRAERSRR